MNNSIIVTYNNGDYKTRLLGVYTDKNEARAFKTIINYLKRTVKNLAVPKKYFVELQWLASYDIYKEASFCTMGDLTIFKDKKNKFKYFLKTY